MICADDSTPAEAGKGYVCPHESERVRFGDSVGRAHGYLMRRLYDALKPDHPELELSFCPAPYSLLHVGNSARAGEGGAMGRYLREMAVEMPPEVKVVWTGPEVVPHSVTREDFLRY